MIQTVSRRIALRVPMYQVDFSMVTAEMFNHREVYLVHLPQVLVLSSPAIR